MSLPKCTSCEGAFSDDDKPFTLVNGELREIYCSHCLRDVAGELVMDNDDIHFEWNPDHTIVTLV